MTSPAMRGRRRVALFMSYGCLPISTSVIDAGKTWDAHGFGFDVYVPRSERFGVPAFGAHDIAVHRGRDLRNDGLPELSCAYATVRAADRADYAYAVGFDQGGLLDDSTPPRALPGGFGRSARAGVGG